MTTTMVHQLLLWLRRADSEFSRTTLLNLFNVAHFQHFGAVDANRILNDIALMESTGQVPFYVTVFCKKHLYHNFVHCNPAPQPKLIV